MTTPPTITNPSALAVKKLTYLATPYMHADPAVREKRFREANRAAAWLMKQGEIVFSPISHSHPIAIQCGLPGDWQFWKEFDEAYLAASKKIVVLMQDGWKESVGVKAELEIAKQLGIEIEYMEAQ